MKKISEIKWNTSKIDDWIQKQQKKVVKRKRQYLGNKWCNTNVSILVFLNIQHVLIIFIIQISTMRMLIALILLFISFLVCKSTSHPPDHTHFLIFSNDGTFYKLDPSEQNVHWHSDLGEKLISFELSDTSPNFQNQLSTYFIPTVQGHFVYIAKNKEILVHRQEIEPLLKICLGNSKDSNDLVLASQQQYFLHQKYEYFFIDLHNGKIWNVQQFFEQKIVCKIGKHALIKISKKYLKQLRPNLQVKWSSISSTIDIVSAIQFLKDPKMVILNEQVQALNYEFRRIPNHQLQVVERVNEKTFQVGGKSPIMAVFSYDKNLSLFQKHPITFYKKPILAIEDKHDTHPEKTMNQIAKAQVNVFPHASEYKEGNKSDKKFKNFEFNGNSEFDFEYCLNTFRVIQQLSSETRIQTNIPFLNKKLEIGKGRQINTQNQYRHYNFPPTEQIFLTSHPHLFNQPQRSQQQPLIWIFIILSLIASGGIFYKLKVGKLMTELQKMQTYHDKKFEQIQKKLGQFEQMQKMYEVYWDKLLYRKPRRKSSDVFEIEVQSQESVGQKVSKPNQIQIYEHLVFEGKFLNKEALVYAVPLDGIDLIHVEHQLNDLLSCSHKSLVKLYYYTKNSQFLLIFCQKIYPLWESIESSSFFSNFQYPEDKTLKNIQNLVNSKFIEKNKQNNTNGDPSLKPQDKQKEKKPNILSQLQINKKLANLIQEIIQSITYLDSKIQVFSIPLEGIILNERTLANSQKDIQKSSLASTFEIQLKINTIPSILQVYKQDEDSQQAKLKSKHNMNIKLRHDLVKIFYSINSRGQKSSIKAIYSMISKEENSDGDSFFVKDFYDFVLNENYNLNIQIDNADKREINQEDKKTTRVLGKNNEFLQNLSCHPFLWDSKRKMLFLSDFSNYIETYLDDFKIKKLQSSSRDYQIIDTPWTKHLDISFVKEINQFRKYDFNSVRDLIRLIRNKVNHFHEIPKETRNSIGKTPEAFVEYMLKLYPKLLSFAFVYAKKKKWKLHVQIK